MNELKMLELFSELSYNNVCYLRYDIFPPYMLLNLIRIMLKTRKQQQQNNLPLEVQKKKQGNAGRWTGFAQLLSNGFSQHLNIYYEMCHLKS